MKIYAQHERDDVEHELTPEQVSELEEELGFSLQQLEAIKIYRLSTIAGWTYRIDWYS